MSRVYNVVFHRHYEMAEEVLLEWQGFEIVDRGKKMNFVSPHVPGDENDDNTHE